MDCFSHVRFSQISSCTASVLWPPEAQVNDTACWKSNKNCNRVVVDSSCEFSHTYDAQVDSFSELAVTYLDVVIANSRYILSEVVAACGQELVT